MLPRSRNTQVTVNNQIVMGTLMNLADHPTRCSVGESWREDKTLRRVPIIITGNDLSTLYAPLLRDGRMTKFLWEPERADLLEMMYTLYRDDGLSLADVEQLLDAFPAQSASAASNCIIESRCHALADSFLAGLDFFGALRARQHDSLIRAWAADLGEVELSKKLRAVLRRRDDADPRGASEDPTRFRESGASHSGTRTASLERKRCQPSPPCHRPCWYASGSFA